MKRLLLRPHYSSAPPLLFCVFAPQDCRPPPPITLLAQSLPCCRTPLPPSRPPPSDDFIAVPPHLPTTHPTQLPPFPAPFPLPHLPPQPLPPPNAAGVTESTPSAGRALRGGAIGAGFAPSRRTITFLHTPSRQELSSSSLSLSSLELCDTNVDTP